MDWSNKVVVITGASSGLGRAAALEFARRGASLVLAARRREALQDITNECRSAGGRAVYQITDVSQEEQVQALAQLALEQSGRIDVWVNNAGVTCFAPLAGVPFDDHRRVIETNLFGAMFGARAVAPVFRRQRRGVLINVGSVLSQIGQPFVPSYVISKFALQGLSEALRTEFSELPDVHVCSLLPYAMDTEHFESGANYLRVAPYPLPPLQPPERVARRLVDLAQHPERQKLAPRSAALGLALHFLSPRASELLLHDLLSRWHFGPGEVPSGSGNLETPLRADGHVHGRRQPRVSTPRLLAYAAARFLVIELGLLQAKVFGDSRLLHAARGAPPMANLETQELSG
jgi:NAD(P)-dependent dehydrogenase (short-subunit alcohol dehydrogenase family)